MFTRLSTHSSEIASLSGNIPAMLERVLITFSACFLNRLLCWKDMEGEREREHEYLEGEREGQWERRQKKRTGEEQAHNTKQEYAHFRL